MAVLAIGFMAVEKLMLGTLYSNKTSRNMAIATTLAQQQMETVRQLSYLGVGASGDTLIEAYGAIPGFPSFQREMAVSSVSGLSGAKAVTVTVQWQHNYTHSVVLKTLISR